MAEAVQTDARKLPYVAAITEGIRTVMSEQDNAFIAGEDVAGAGGVYGYYAGILKEFGPERVFDTPISEEGIVGLGVGSAATGCTAARGCGRQAGWRVRRKPTAPREPASPLNLRFKE